MNKPVLVAGLTSTLLLAVAYVGSSSEAAPSERDALATSVPTDLRCHFDAGDRAAFAFDSQVSLEGANDAADGTDRFSGTWTWQVERAGEESVLRAALHDVRLDQTLSRERVDTDELVRAPFFVKVDERCHFTGLGFDPTWSAASRRLVTSLFDGLEVVLPEQASAAAWQTEQHDEIGTYVGEYTAARSETDDVLVRRRKSSYRVDEDARQLGMRVQVLGAETDARFDTGRPAWMRRVEGRELVRFVLPGREAQAFVHRFEAQRDDTAIAALDTTLALANADFSSVDELALSTPDPIDPELAALDRDEVLAQFLARFAAEGRSASFGAARSLAAWLRAHPEETPALLAALRDGDLDPIAHASLFLALELAGTDASREALTEALVDAELTDLNRSRAAVALANHGVPSRASADALLAQARGDASGMVSSVSLLGVGTMARRAGDAPLRGELREALTAELERTTGAREEAVAIDALGNARDDAFATTLDERLHGERPELRAHAADAIGKLSPEVARPLLTDRLETESDPAVATAILRSLGRLGDASGTLSPDQLALAARRLGDTPREDERSAWIEWLGSARTQREARVVLARHFPVEPSARLQQRIGAFVPANELRELSR